MLHILHLEDQEDDAFLIKKALIDHNLSVEVTRVGTREQFLTALEKGGFDLFLTDSSLSDIEGTEAMRMAHEKFPELAIVALSGVASEERARAAMEAGALNFIEKDDLWQLVAVVRAEEDKNQLQRMNRGMMRLVAAVQELSLAHDLASIMAIVRRAAREITGADGASFVLRDRECCYYADEDAIEPLWKGHRFPLENCVSGWAMLNRKPAIIPDIYSDSRVPIKAYRPTFVKSMAMVPIRAEAPIGAIGNYWATPHQPTREEVDLLQALANTTSVAMENVQVYSEMEQRVKDRTAALEAANQELEAFSYAVSHDLRAPLRSIRGFTEIVLKEGAGQIGEINRSLLDKVRHSGEKMTLLIEDLLRMAKFSRVPLRKEKVDLTKMALEVTERLAAAPPERKVTVRIAEGLEVIGDAGLLQAVVENLLSNAWKYSSKVAEAVIEFDAVSQPNGVRAFRVRDNGAGFDMRMATKLFQPFQRLHSERDFAGTGVGLATVQRIIQRHGGRIWAESKVGKGAAFYFELEGA